MHAGVSLLIIIGILVLTFVLGNMIEEGATEPPQSQLDQIRSTSSSRVFPRDSAWPRASLSQQMCLSGVRRQAQAGRTVFTGNAWHTRSWWRKG